MPRFEKGSKEAMAWAAKMKKAREAKKSIKGGMVTDDPFGLTTSGQKLTLKRGIVDKSTSPPKKSVKVDVPDIDFKPIKTEKVSGTTEIKRPIAKKSKAKSMTGGFLSPGEVPLASTDEGLVAEKELYAPREIKSSEFMIDEKGGAICKNCRMCGGAMLSNPDNQYVPQLQAKLQKSRFDSGEILGGRIMKKKKLLIIEE